MADIIDRRSANGDGAKENPPEDGGKLDLTSEREIRRTAGGGRTWSEFFSQGNRDKPMRRGEVLGLLEMIEYSRRAGQWWRRLRRWLFRMDGMVSMPDQMADAYVRKTLRPTQDAVQAELDKRDAKQESL